MTRDQQIRKALACITPNRERRANCEHEVGMAVDYVGREKQLLGHLAETISKPAKEKLQAYRSAVDRARVAYKSLHDDTRGTIRLRRIVHSDSVDDLDFEKELAAIDAALAIPPRKQSHDFTPELYAAEFAALIAIKYDHPLVLTRGSVWLRLAAILFGEEGRDMLRHCKRWRQNAAASS